MELFSKLAKEDNDNAASMANVNISTARIKKILEETPATIEVEMEPMKLF